MPALSFCSQSDFFACPDPSSSPTNPSKVHGEIVREKKRHAREVKGKKPHRDHLAPRCWNTLYQSQHPGAYWYVTLFKVTFLSIV
jgi:hypothetical protein